MAEDFLLVSVPRVFPEQVILPEVLLGVPRDVDLSVSPGHSPGPDERGVRTTRVDSGRRRSKVRVRRGVQSRWTGFDGRECRPWHEFHDSGPVSTVENGRWFPGTRPG